MPLHQIINHSPTTKILVWKITEPLQELEAAVRLNPNSSARLADMKSEQHRCGFLSVRKLLQEAGYTDFDLYYDEFGKPHLSDGKHISISHSFGFSSIIISDEKIGIDLELRRDKIKIIDYKFAAPELPYLNAENHADYISRLTVIWGVKEAIFKIRNEKGISFNDHIYVRPFAMAAGEAVAELQFENILRTFRIYFEEIENYTLVYATED